MFEYDMDTIIKIYCCHRVRIHGDIKNIEGDPKDISNELTPQVFMKALDYYLKKDVVEVKVHHDSNWIKLKSAYNDSGENEPGGDQENN